MLGAEYWGGGGGGGGGGALRGVIRDLLNTAFFIRPDSLPIGGPEEHARCFSAVTCMSTSLKVSKKILCVQLFKLIFSEKWLFIGLLDSHLQLQYCQK